MSKHTPGPWILADGFARADTSRHFVWSDAESKEEREDDSPFCIAMVNPRTNDSELDANARLIAAAPELAEALEDAHAKLRSILNAYPKEIGPLHCGTLACALRARAVLAKAGL